MAWLSAAQAEMSMASWPSATLNRMRLETIGARRPPEANTNPTFTFTGEWQNDFELSAKALSREPNAECA